LSGPPPVALWVSVVLLVMALLLQVTLLPGMTPAGVRPDLLLAVLLCIGVLNGIGVETAILGLSAGFAADFLAGYLIGLNAFLLLGSVLVADRVLQSFTRSNVVILFGVVVTLNFFSELIRAVAVRLSGMELGPVHVVALISATSALYTGLAAALLYYFMGKYLSIQEPVWGWERGARR